MNDVGFSWCVLSKSIHNYQNDQRQTLEHTKLKRDINSGRVVNTKMDPILLVILSWSDSLNYAVELQCVTNAVVTYDSVVKMVRSAVWDGTVNKVGCARTNVIGSSTSFVVASFVVAYSTLRIACHTILLPTVTLKNNHQYFSTRSQKWCNFFFR